MDNFSISNTQLELINALIRVISSPEATKARLDEIIAAAKKLEAAQQDLLGTQSLGAIREELAQRENMLSIRQATIEEMEARQKTQREAVAAAAILA